MSKVSFRARALDSTKPLTLYYSEELPDLAEYVAINRQVPQMPTGMEKEEESECHLQQVMMARQTLQDSAKVVIPTPEASIPANHYTEVYQSLPHYPQQYVRMPGLALDEEAVDYDLDSEDDEWLSVQSQERPLSPLHFERMMDRLEKGSGNTVLSVRDAQLLLKDEDDLVIAVYDYWLAKRLRLGRSLVPIVKHERRDGSSSSNPYLAFRKRTEKMQTRKNRKNDEMAYMHMLKLKRDLARAITLVERVKEREKNKKDLALVYNEIFQKRYQLEDWSGSLISTLRPVATPSQTSSDRHPLAAGSMTWEGKGLFKVDSYDDGIHSIGRHDILLSGSKKKSKKKSHKYSLSPLVDVETPLLATVDKGCKETPGEPVEKVDVEEPDGAFTFKRKVHVHYYTPNRSLGEWPWESSSSTNEPASKKFHFSATSLGSNICCFSRRRVGRGGRAMWDCLAPLDSEGDDSERLLEEDLQKIDVESLASESAIHDGDLDTVSSTRHLFFHPRSPDDNFELTCLPLVEPSTYPCPDPCSGFTDFGGASLDPDCVNEVSSFSALPTSQFALWPSTSDMDADSDGEEAYDPAPARPSAVGLEPSASATAASALESKAPVAPTSSVSTELTGKQTHTLQPSQLPSTQLTAIQGGLPVQIHVENIRHLPVPRKEASSVHPKDAGIGIGHASTAAGLREGAELQPIPWHFESPGGGLMALNAPTQRARRCSRLRHITVSGSVAAQITSEFVTEKRSMKEEKELSNDVSSVVAKVGVVAPAPPPPIASGRSDLQQPLTQQQQHTGHVTATPPLSTAAVGMSDLVSLSQQQHTGHVTATPPLSTAAVGMSDLVSLSQQHRDHFTNNAVMNDGKVEVLVKEKRALGTVPAPNHQKGSPNGCVPELLHSRKIPSDGDKELKAAGTVTHNNSVVDSGSNSLVQLAPSSEIT